MALDILSRIAQELSLQPFQVVNTARLLFQEECTVPFVARYRKEVTGAIDEVQIRNIRDRYSYLTEVETTKAKYLKVIEEFVQKNPTWKAKFPEIKDKLLKALTKQELEDIYLPFKPKRRTRAQIAKEKGLELLLNSILEARATLTTLDILAKDFVTPADSKIDPSIKVADIAAALAGAGDIYAETIAETSDWRVLVRKLSFESAYLVAKKNETSEDTEKKPEATGKNSKHDKKNNALVYQNYFDYRESIHSSPAHRVMAVRRGEAEKFLRVSIEVNREQIISELQNKIVRGVPTSPVVASWLNNVVLDAYDRLVSPSIETEIRLDLKTKAETESMKVFTKNLEKLLLLPPVPKKVVMGVDPGFRTGSKLAVINETGAMLEATTVYPDFNQGESSQNAKTTAAKETLLGLLKKHSVDCVAIGNGTGGREMDKLVNQVLKDNNLSQIKRITVNEAGASVYSTDEIAREEFPDLDPTIRSAISIARRLQDPLAELVKIDPRSIGVGQYQHDVNVNKLKQSLEEVVESCVNKVGVNLNTASYKLLGYVSGIGATLAKSIVTFRGKNGRFECRSDLQKIPGFGPKCYQQAAGFLRVPDSANPLDNSAVHPERYDLVEQVAKAQASTVSDLVGKPEVIQRIAWEKFVTESLGLPTLRDIAAELIKPGRDPREDGVQVTFSDDILELEDLKPNMSLKGTVTNVTNFGAFVDIGVHQDGLIHISELSDQFVKDPSTVVAVGDVLSVRVLEVDKLRRRISLSARSQPVAQAKPDTSRDQPRPQNNNKQNQRQKPPEQHFTMNDLLAKFGK